MSLLSNKPRLDDLLVRSGLVSRSLIRRAVDEAHRGGHSLCEILVRQQLVDEQQLVNLLADKLEMPAIGQESLSLDEGLLGLLPDNIREARDLLPLKQTGKTLTVAMADPTDEKRLQAIARSSGLKVLPMIAPISALHEVYLRQESLRAMHRDADKDGGFSRFLPFFEKCADYRFERIIGEGGFALVCLCFQLSLERKVAIKVLNPDWNPVAQVTERFKREGQIIARLDHPNIINVYEQGERDGIRYIVMEYFEGMPISQYLKGQDWGRKISVLRQVCSAIAYAHEQGVIHRDIKPGNLLVNELGEIKLLDFGVSHLDTFSSKLTTAQLVLGTPKYMAPEIKSDANQAGPLSDIYAFGVMAYEIMAEREFDPMAPESLSRIDECIPSHLDEVILRCIDRQPRRRPASFVELVGAFQQSLDEMIFGEATREHRFDESQPSQSKIQNLERLFNFKQVFRNNGHTRTILAHSYKLGRDVMIKIMNNPQGVGNLRELANLKDFHIGDVYGLGHHGELVLTVSEFLRGGSLYRRMQNEIPPRVIVQYLEGIVHALNQADKLNLGHGSLHPNNILLGENEVIKVVDFGLTTGANPTFSRFTDPVKNKPVRERDRYALGLLAFEMMCGEEFPGGKLLAAFNDYIAQDPMVHPLLRYFLGRLWLVKEQTPPYESYGAMIQDLERIGHRLEEQPEWTVDRTPSKRPVKEATPASSLIHRTIHRLASRLASGPSRS